MSCRCSHHKVHIVKTKSWNGTEYETHFHCGRCGCILKPETVRLGNKQTVTRYVEQEEGVLS